MLINAFSVPQSMVFEAAKN